MDQNHRATLLREHYATLQSFWRAFSNAGYCAILLGQGISVSFSMTTRTSFSTESINGSVASAKKNRENSWFILRKEPYLVFFISQTLAPRLQPGISLGSPVAESL